MDTRRRVSNAHDLGASVETAGFARRLGAWPPPPIHDSFVLRRRGTPRLETRGRVVRGSTTDLPTLLSMTPSGVPVFEPGSQDDEVG